MYCGIQISPQDDRQKDKKMFGSNKSISDFYHLLSSTVHALSDAGNNLHHPLASTETQACEFSVNTFPLEKT